MNIKIRPFGILKRLLIITGVLLFLHIVRIYSKFYTSNETFQRIFRIFDFDKENTIPAVFSFLLLFSSAMLLLLIVYIRRDKAEKYASWLLLSFIFVFLSLDEILSFHERLTDFFWEEFQLSGLLYFSWVVPYAIALSVMAFIYIPFLIKLPKKSMLLFLLAGGLFVGGAMGIELFGGRHSELYGHNLQYFILFTLEELLEMLGTTVFIYALVDYISSYYKEINLKFRT